MDSKKQHKKLQNIDNEVCRVPVIPDKTEEIIRLAREETTRNNQQQQKNLQFRQKLKHDRILVNKINKYVQVIDLLIEKAKELGNKFTVSYYYFDFEDRFDARMMFEEFLNKLRNIGCFKSFESTYMVSEMHYLFRSVDKNKLINYKKIELEQGNGNQYSFLMTYIPKGKKYKVIRQMVRVLIKRNGEADNLCLARCLKLESSLTREGYNQKPKLKSEIKNHLRTLNKYWQPQGFCVSFSHVQSKIKQIQ